MRFSLTLTKKKRTCFRFRILGRQSPEERGGCRRVCSACRYGLRVYPTIRSPSLRILSKQQGGGGVPHSSPPPKLTSRIPHESLTCSQGLPSVRVFGRVTGKLLGGPGSNFFIHPEPTYLCFSLSLKYSIGGRACEESFLTIWALPPMSWRETCSTGEATYMI